MRYTKQQKNQIDQLNLNGLPSREIASQLGLSKSGVNDFLKRNNCLGLTQKSKIGNKGSKILVIPDVQAKQGHSFAYLNRLGHYIVEKKPDKIICLGDFADMPSLSSYDAGKKSFEGRRYVLDIEASKSSSLGCAIARAFWKMW